MSEHIPGVQHDPVLHKTTVDGVHIPNDVLTALGRLAPGDKLTIRRVNRVAMVVEGAAPPPLPERADAEEKPKPEVSVRRPKCVWPPDKAEAPFPESLKLNGENPDGTKDKED